MRPARIVAHLFLLTSVFIVGGCGSRATTSEPALDSIASAGSEAEAAPRSEWVLAVFTRSCAPCHRREGGSAAAIANGAFLETLDDITTAMSSYAVGHASSGLNSLLGWIERDGELRIEPTGALMPPADSGVPPITPEEAHRIHLWHVAGD